MSKKWIFDCIEKKLKIDLDKYLDENERGEEYLRTIVSNETCFRKKLRN